MSQNQRRSERLRETPAKNYSQTRSRINPKLPSVLDKDENESDVDSDPEASENRKDVGDEEGDSDDEIPPYSVISQAGRQEVVNDSNDERDDLSDDDNFQKITFSPVSSVCHGFASPTSSDSESVVFAGGDESDAGNKSDDLGDNEPGLTNSGFMVVQGMIEEVNSSEEVEHQEEEDPLASASFVEERQAEGSEELLRKGSRVRFTPAKLTKSGRVELQSSQTFSQPAFESPQSSVTDSEAGDVSGEFDGDVSEAGEVLAEEARHILADLHRCADQMDDDDDDEAEDQEIDREDIVIRVNRFLADARADRDRTLDEPVNQEAEEEVPEAIENIELSDNFEDLSAWLDPEVPLSQPPPDQATDPGGWTQIDGWGGWECLLTSTQPMDDVPDRFKVKFGKGFDYVLRRFESAASEEEVTRALKWFLVLPRALLRQSSRGGKKGQAAADQALRFDLVLEGEWGKLLHLLERDELRAFERKQRRECGGREEDMEKKRESVLRKVSEGQVSRAMNLIKSNGVADICLQATKDALQRKFPARSQHINTRVSSGQPVDSLACLREAMLGLQRGAGSGPGGCKNEYLIALADVWEVQEMARFERFCMTYLKGELPPWMYRLLTTITTVPLYKTEERSDDKLRPVGVSHPVVRLLHRDVIKTNKQTITDFLEPEQLGLSPCGGQKLVNTIRTFAETNPGFIVIKIDLDNAHSAIYRKAVIDAIQEERTLRHLSKFAVCTMAPKTALESMGQVWGEAGEGLVQGNPASGGKFCIGIQKDLKELNKDVDEVGGCARGGQDDIFVVAPADPAFRAVQKFENAIFERCGLRMQRSKTQVLVWDGGELPPNTPNGYIRAGSEIDGIFRPGLYVYGIPVGSKEWVKKEMMAKVKEIEAVKEKTCALLEKDNQTLWTLLRCSLSQMLDYHLQLVYPSDMIDAAVRFDEVCWSMLQVATGLKIPRSQHEQNATKLPGNPIHSLSGSSFQEVLVRLPVRLGGLGLQSARSTMGPAFLGGVEMSVPHFTGHDGLMPQLQNTLGDVSGHNRWRTLLESGSRLGEEFLLAFDTIQEEGSTASNYLRTNLEGVLASSAANIGEGSTDGSTRHHITEALQNLRYEAAREAMTHHPNPKVAHLLKQFDKMSQAWLGALPGPLTYIPGPEFQQAMAWHLALPSPVCKDIVGRPVGKEGAVVDPHGERVMCAKLPFDSWRHRHDWWKLALEDILHESRIIADVEVYGKFSHLIPSTATGPDGALSTLRDRQALVPDFSLKLHPTAQLDTLAELKFISAGIKWYSSGRKQVDVRAREIQADYRKKCKDIDRDYHGTRVDEIGPLQHHLESHGKIMDLVVGQYGETSQGVHDLMDAIATSRAECISRAEGRPLSNNERSGILAAYRRRLSVIGVRSQSKCLLERMGHIGQGASAAAERRQKAMRTETAARKERQSHYEAYIRGKKLSNRGNLCLI